MRITIERMPLFIASAAFFVVVSVLHLIACGLHRDGLRKPTKVFLVPLIACMHISICGFRYPLVLAGLFCGWLGDIFLIPKDKKLTFYLGALFFMIGHGFYIANAFSLGLPQQVLSRCGRVSLLIAMLAVVAVGFAALWFMRKRISREMIRLFAVYMLALLTMAGTFVYSSVAVGLRAPAFMLAIGAVLFALSDFLLGAGITRAFRIRNNRLLVMLTYIFAQLGIAVGTALL